MAQPLPQLNDDRMVDVLLALGYRVDLPSQVPDADHGFVPFRLGAVIAVAQAHLERMGGDAPDVAARGYHAAYLGLFDHPCPCDDH